MAERESQRMRVPTRSAHANTDALINVDNTHATVIHSVSQD